MVYSQQMDISAISSSVKQGLLENAPFIHLVRCVVDVPIFSYVFPCFSREKHPIFPSKSARHVAAL
jgi:hypothetical protein